MTAALKTAPKAAKKLLAIVTRALGALGQLNDCSVALALLEPQARAQPGAWFAVGWLSARRETLLERAAEAVAALDGAPRPWRGR